MNYVIISAYRAERFIEECINSIDVNILLGVDGCSRTLRKVRGMKSKKLRIFNFPENSGPYIIFNTLISKLNEDDSFIIFGADDVMNPGMTKEMFNNKPCISKHMGVICLTKSMFDEFGGFMPWRSEADNNLIKRIEKKHKIKVLPKMFYRREHPGQLTKGRYGFKTKYRRILKSITKRMLKKGILYIKPELADCHEV